MADIFIQASQIPEPLGLSVLEAQIRSLPVVAVNAGGTAEIVMHEVNGLVYEQNSEAGLIKSILRFVESSELRLKLAAGAAESAAKLEAQAWTKTIESYY